jgi:condensin complex subunit 2
LKKINAKNAFQLKLIDYMSDIVLNKEIVGGTTNFQVVGCTIDVGTKIYAARVDALHHNTYQMLSGLAQGGGDGNENNEQALGNKRFINLR